MTNQTLYTYPGELSTEVAANLTDLMDVSIENPQEGDYLFYDWLRGVWSNAPIVVQVDIGNLEDLDNVDVTGPQQDDVLTYNFASAIWENKPSQAGGATTLNELTDVDTTGAQEGQALIFKSSIWQPGQGGGFERATLVPASFSMPSRQFFDNFALVQATTFTLQAGSVDGTVSIGNLVSDGASAITWGPEFRRFENRSAALPTVLPAGDNIVVFVYDGTANQVLVDIRTQLLTADGALPMTGDLDLGRNNIVNINRIEAEYALREPFTAPSSGAWTPSFDLRSDFWHGSLTGPLTINNPTGQQQGQEGVIMFDNLSGQTVTLGTNFVIMNGQDPTIGAARTILPYKVFSPGVIFYSVDTA